MPRIRMLFLLGVPLVLAPGRSSAGEPTWEEILLVDDGRYNNAARIDYTGYFRMAWKWQIGTDSTTRQIAAATPAGTPWVWSFDDLTTTAASKEYPDVAVTWNDVAHVVWREFVGGSSWQIFYANDVGGVWSAPRQITFDAPVKGSPVIAVADTSGFVHVAYSTLEPGTTDDEIWYVLYDTVGNTSQSIPVTNDAVTDDDVSIDVTPGGVVSLAWVSGSFTGAIRCAQGDIGGFTEIPTGVTADAAKPDLELDFDGLQHIAYRHTVTSSSRPIRYLRRQGNGFAAPIDASPADAFYNEPSILVANGGWPSIAYVSNTATKKGLYVSSWDFDHFEPPQTVHADESVTYNETDFEVDALSVGLPSRTLNPAFLVTSTGYVEADTVRADLHLFQGFVLAVSAPGPDVAGPAGLSLTVGPNPFHSATTIRFALPDPAAHVRLDVHDVRGRRVERLVDGPRALGLHDVGWTPRDLPAGVYWLRLDADGRVASTPVDRVR